jgi:hypothetical protein
MSSASFILPQYQIPIACPPKMAWQYRNINSFFPASSENAQ